MRGEPLAARNGLRDPTSLHQQPIKIEGRRRVGVHGQRQVVRLAVAPESIEQAHRLEACSATDRRGVHRVAQHAQCIDGTSWIAPPKQASLQQRRARIVCPRRACRGEPRPQCIVPMREPEELAKRHAGLDSLQRSAGRHRAQAIGSLIDAPEPLVHDPTQERNLRIRRSERIEPFECFIGFGDPAHVQLRARHAEPCLQHARVLRSERPGHRQRVERSPLSEQALDRGDW